MKITKKTVDALVVPTAKPVTSWDDQLKGFGVTVHPSGKRAYVVNYRNDAGRQRRLTLGTHGKLTPEQARGLATQRLAEVAAGRDPLQERRTARQRMTLAELVEQYLAEHASKKRSGHEDRRTLTRDVLPRLGNRLVADITRADIGKLHTSMSDRPVMANRMLGVLGVVFQFAEGRGERPAGTNPIRGLKRNREKARDRLMSEAELARLGDALVELAAEGSDGAQWASILRLLLLTGCRRAEILDLRWKEVDFERGLLHLAESKTGARSVPLSPPAREVLEKQPRTSTSEFVFFPGGADLSRAVSAGLGCAR